MPSLLKLDAFFFLLNTREGKHGNNISIKGLTVNRITSLPTWGLLVLQRENILIIRPIVNALALIWYIRSQSLEVSKIRKTSKKNSKFFLFFFRIIDDNNFSYFVPLFLKLQVTVIIFTYNWNSLIDIIIIKTKVHLP
jgi:hypothetical protein